MKIYCDKNEFAKLVRSCAFITGRYNGTDNACSKCVFSAVCSREDKMTDGDVMSVIEDICVIGEVPCDG